LIPPRSPGAADDVKDLFGLERLRQDVIAAFVENLCPQALVCQTVRHDDGRRRVDSGPEL
jgi:hypothetical protein